jgi:hypothetical protein
MSYALLVGQFLVTWLFFVGIITAVVFLTNIDWARPQFEQLLSQSIKRKVKLGRMTWNLGLNGMAIAAHNVQVKENNGQPFLEAGPSELGVAFLPLMQGRLIIKHIKMQKPEVWATRLTRDNWNFSDLVKPGPDIRFVDAEQGRLHIIDRSQKRACFAPYDLVDVGLKLTLPHKDRRWPVFFSCSLPRDGYVTRIKLTAIGRGSFDDWQTDDLSFNLNAERVNPRDLEPLGKSLKELGGLYDLKVTGGGTLASGIAANATARISDMVIHTQTAGTLKAEQAVCSTSLNLNSKRLTWRDFNLSFGNVAIRSQGELANWQEAQPDYQADVKGQIQDLKQLSANFFGGPATASDTSSQTSPGSNDASALLALLDLKKLTGKAEFDILVHGKNTNPQLSTNIKASEVSTAELLEKGPLKHFPWLAKLLAQESSKLKGEVKIADNQRVDLPSADITAGKGGMHISGYWDKQADKAQFKFSGQRIDLAALLHSLKSSKEFTQFLERRTAIRSAAGLSAAGAVDIDGTFEGGESARKLTVNASLKNASFAVPARNFHAGQLNGRIHFDGSSVHISDLSGLLGQAKFSLDGLLATEEHKPSSLNFHGQDVNLDNLNAAMQTFELSMPILSEHQLYGHVKQLTLRIAGPADNPQVGLTMEPDDLYYQAPGVSRPLRATGGSIAYDHDELVLREVPLVSHNNQLLTNLDIANLSTTSDLKRVKVKSTGVELADVNYYLSSALMPPVLRKGYQDFLQRFQLSNARGKAYGNLLWQAKGRDGFDLDGVVGLYNTSLKVGNAGWPLERVSGILAASGEELLVQDISGSIGGNSFNLDGHVTNYRSESASWQTELRANVTPERVLRLVPDLAQQFGGKITTNRPLTLRAMVAGDFQSDTIVFGLRASPDDHLRIITPFGVVAQPANQPITLDGSLQLDNGKAGSVQLNNANLIVGTSLLQAKGKYSWFDPASRKQPALSLDISAPNPVPAQTVAAVLNLPGKSDKVGGTVKGELSTAGPINQLTSKGFMSFQKLTLPEFNIFESSGRVETPGWSFDGSDLSKTAKAGSQTNLHIDTARLASLETKDVDAKLVLEAGSSESQPSQRVVLRNGQAHVAGGTFAGDGWVDLKDHNWHLEAQLNKVQASSLVSQLMGHPGELSGEADARLVLDSTGCDYKEIVRNCDGKFNLTVESGKVTRFGPLQEKLTQANLIQSGVFGFNFNNLLQSVVPVRTGEFKDLDAALSVSSGIIKIEQLKFNGDDMRLRAAGTINPNLKTISLEVAGNVPRVSTSVLSGAVGEMSRGLSIQKLLSLLTAHKLENLPPLPLLGDIADDRPRAFTFRVIAPMDNSHLIGQSIQKSFHWLPSHPNASAHPVPSLTN